MVVTVLSCISARCPPAKELWYKAIFLAMCDKIYPRLVRSVGRSSVYRPGGRGLKFLPEHLPGS